MNRNLFSYSRFALQYGLKELGIEPGSGVLVPDYNCEVIYYPLRRLGLELQFYSLHDDFTPNWDSINRLLNHSTRALMMVHYFGQPQPINLFRKLAAKHQLLLIEDNAHGYSGSFNGKLLGTFGDIGFASPRKQLNLAYGGTLYIKGKEIFSPNAPIDSMHKMSFKMEILKAMPRLRLARHIFKKYFLTKPVFSSPSYFVEVESENVLIDHFASNKIMNTDWELIGRKRRDAWSQWAEFCEKRSLRPVWEKAELGTCPWIMPAFVQNEEIRTRILNVAWETGLGLLPWPTLPQYVLEHSPNAVRRWKHLVCFPLHKIPIDCKAEIRAFDQQMNCK